MQFIVSPLLVAVVEEGAEQAGVEVVQHRRQQILVEFKRVGKLLGDLLKHNEHHTIAAKQISRKDPEHHLPDAVDPLEEDGASLFIVMFVITVTNTLTKLVSKTQPFFLNQNLHKSYYGK